MTSVICVICLEGENTEWSTLPCGHVFHKACLEQWLNQDASCPHCKRRLLHSRGAAMRIYFASENDREQLRNQSEAATSVDEERDQLREMLFMESQERQVALNQAHDSEKTIAKLRDERNREAQQLHQFSIDYENLQMLMINKDEQIKEAKRLTALQQRESQELISQLQIANQSLNENSAQLNQRLRSAEQKNSELRVQLDSLQAAGNSSASRLQAKQENLELQVAELQSSVEFYKLQLESKQRDRQMEATQLREELENLKATYSRLRTTANEEINALKQRNASAEVTITDSNARVRAADERFERLERENTALRNRLQTQELQMQRLQAGEDQPAGAVGWIEPPPTYEQPDVVAATDEGQDNFSGFPVFTRVENNWEQKQRQPQSSRAIQRSTPNLQRAVQEEEGAEHVYYASPTDGARAADRAVRKAKAKNSRKCRQM
ncbi:hypothetical protein BOX15_Mlig021142g1 [Macrostomum lignano]|uniref:RING-type domain-containing protein n=1 Tax=Macrostomum lignano TaxID=282301 RepID=A0A267EAC4_9PLAT|nr:hypothetical protein BOX15_Mlig021142g1 [Macrostomum lignano]